MSSTTEIHRPQVETGSADRSGASNGGASTGSPGRTLTRKGRFLLLGLAVLVLDQWSKWLVELHIPHSVSIVVIDGFFNLTHVRNTGVAFGLFPSDGDSAATGLLVALGLAALIFVAFYFWRAPPSDIWLLLALALVLGGAIGNVLDRAVSGAVTDFLDFYIGSYHWHTFNVADSAITIGIGLMILGAIVEPRSEEA